MAGIPASSKLARRGARASATSRSLSSFSWRMSISCRCSSAISNCRTVNIRTTAIPHMKNKAAIKPHLHHSIPLLAQSNLGIRFATLRLAVCNRLLVRLLVRLKNRYRGGAREYAAHIIQLGCAFVLRPIALHEPAAPPTACGPPLNLSSSSWRFSAGSSRFRTYDRSHNDQREALRGSGVASERRCEGAWPYV